MMAESGQFSDNDYSDDCNDDNYDDDENDVYADEYSLGEYEEDEEQYYNDTDEDEETDDDHYSDEYSEDEGPEIVYSKMPRSFPPDKYMVRGSEAGKLKRRGWDVMAMLVSLSVALVLGYFSVI